MHRFVTYTIIGMMSLSLSACFIEEQMLYKPYSMAELPKGSPDFTQGWRDGCKTGFSSYGNPEYKMIYNFTQDPAKVKPDDRGQPSTYHKAWRDGYNYCRHYSQVWSKPMLSGDGFVPPDKFGDFGNDDPFFGGGGDFFTSETDLFSNNGDISTSFVPACGRSNPFC